MNPPEPDDRIERLKQVLAGSYPRVADERSQEPLPASVRTELAGSARPALAKKPVLDRLLSWLRGPQLIALGAAAVVALVAMVALGPSGSDDSSRQAMRSSGGTVGGPPLIVLRDLTPDQSAALRDSGYFRSEQMIEFPEDADLTTFLEARRRPGLILVDGTAGAISTPFAAASAPAPVPFSPADDLAPLVLDVLAGLPETSE